MSKRILIVESDATLATTLQQALEARGFSAQTTGDGKGSVELIRRERPDLVVLAVDLSAGQNGYLICGKLKKDDELKTVPIVIIGSPDGFAAHSKLKARADEYVAKPVDADVLIERVGGVIGFPEPPVSNEVVEDESLTLDSLGEEPATDFGSEEIAVDTGEEAAVAGEDLDMLDDAFSDLSEPVTGTPEEPVVAPPEEMESPSGLEEISALDSLGPDNDDSLDMLGGLDEPEEKTVIGFMPPVDPEPVAAAPTPPPARAAAAPLRAVPPPATTRPAVAAPVTSAAAPGPSAADLAELRNLRAKVAELTSALEDARAETTQVEERVQSLESELQAKATELEASRSTAGKSDKDTFALRDTVNKRDKEILRLKSELNQKDQEIIELKDQHLELEQKASTSDEELNRRDAQIKTLTSRTEQLTTERKRVDQQLATAKEEARGATARLGTLQAELDQHQAQAQEMVAEADSLRAQVAQQDADLQAAREEAEGLRSQVEAAQGELEGLRGQLEQAQADLSNQSAQAAAEADGLRARITELEQAAVRNEERVTKLYARIKGDEKLREKTKKALAIAQQLLDEPGTAVDADADEEAAA
ncbi:MULTISPECIES: response regulator [unclassified Corallococcus]|uniref:response regulator n=1 Tax=unclassified Corallococcus TaxID=2685029 RepID=UPI001A8C5E69|nr:MULTISPECIES: response regulator [unclassified Corallococcus]MBN9684977.1 response regulator [Corallococcus sp. NCSPR001]WAS83561.1 response regulator [Corallococcus sp. NCRR]